MFNINSKDILNIFQEADIYKIGFLSFNFGIFLLFSAPLIASFFLLVSLIFSFSFSNKNYLRDKLNILLITVGLLMITSCGIFYLQTNGDFSQHESNLNTPPLVGLINWIPLFISYIGFQDYLISKHNRQITGICLICGSIPILVSGFGQYFFGWYGPLEFLNGVIIWYQRQNNGAMTGLFNNQNYAGCALATVFPFFYASFLKNKDLTFTRIIITILTLLTVLGIIFTYSRNGLLCLLIGAFIMLIPTKSRLIILSSITFFTTLLLNYLLNLIFNINLIPFKLIQKLNYENLLNDPRILIWNNSLNYISERPLLGWGGNSFSSLWNNKDLSYYSHSHSMPIEISIQYGLITSILLSILIFFILIKSFRLIFLDSNLKLINFKKDNFFDRGWYTASIVILLANTLDILYFDIRISLLTWIFLAGLRNVIFINEKE